MSGGSAGGIACGCSTGHLWEAVARGGWYPSLWLGKKHRDWRASVWEKVVASVPLGSDRPHRRGRRKGETRQPWGAGEEGEVSGGAWSLGVLQQDSTVTVLPAWGEASEQGGAAPGPAGDLGRETNVRDVALGHRAQVSQWGPPRLSP